MKTGRTICGALLAGFLAFGACAARAGQPSDANAAFQKLKAMAGHWEGTTSDGKKVSDDFEVVSEGSAVMERILPDGKEHTMDMVTMYHVDGDRLMMTHYCAVGNQPRMAADAFAPGSNKLVFNFIDATNMKTADDGHMGRVEIQFLDPNHVNVIYTFYKDQKPAMTETFRLART